MNKINILLIITLLVSCSANQINLKSQLSPSNSLSTFKLKKNVTIKASNTKATTLQAGTNWKEIGTIEQGTVYKTKDQVVIVNSFNVHEGYIVINNNQVVGYYLPIEGTFVKSKPTPVSIIEMEINNEI